MIQYFSNASSGGDIYPRQKLLTGARTLNVHKVPEPRDQSGQYHKPHACRLEEGVNS